MTTIPAKFHKQIATMIEKAFDEGYREGYNNGSSDATAYERGSSKHADTCARERRAAWKDSDAKGTADAIGLNTHDWNIADFS